MVSTNLLIDIILSGNRIVKRILIVQLWSWKRVTLQWIVYTKCMPLTANFPGIKKSRI